MFAQGHPWWIRLWKEVFQSKSLTADRGCKGLGRLDPGVSKRQKAEKIAFWLRNRRGLAKPLNRGGQR
jgi:hypothetical protein